MPLPAPVFLRPRHAPVSGSLSCFPEPPFTGPRGGSGKQAGSCFLVGPAVRSRGRPSRIGSVIRPSDRHPDGRRRAPGTRLRCAANARPRTRARPEPIGRGAAQAALLIHHAVWRTGRWLRRRVSKKFWRRTVWSHSNLVPRSQDVRCDREDAETGDAKQGRTGEFQASIKLLYRKNGYWPERTHDIDCQRRYPRDAELEHEARDGDDRKSCQRKYRQGAQWWSHRRLANGRLDAS